MHDIYKKLQMVNTKIGWILWLLMKEEEYVADVNMNELTQDIYGNHTFYTIADIYIYQLIE